MALTIKKTKSGLLIPKTAASKNITLSNTLNKYFSASEENIVTDQIRFILKERLNIKGKMDVRRMEYFVVYQMDEMTNEKQIGTVYMRHKITNLRDRMTAEEIELTGVHLIEFFDYINTHGATEIQDHEKILELA